MVKMAPTQNKVLVVSYKGSRARFNSHELDIRHTPVIHTIEMCSHRFMSTIATIQEMLPTCVGQA